MGCFANPNELKEEFLGISVPSLAYVCEDDLLANGMLIAGITKCEVGVGMWEIEEGDGTA